VDTDQSSTDDKTGDNMGEEKVMRRWTLIVLAALSEEDMSHGDILERTSVPSGSLSNVLDRLIEYGFVNFEYDLHDLRHGRLYTLEDDRMGEVAREFCDMFYDEEVY